MFTFREFLGAGCLFQRKYLESFVGYYGVLEGYFFVVVVGSGYIGFIMEPINAELYKWASDESGSHLPISNNSH